MCCTILECLNLNLTFDLGTWFLHATHCLVMMIISAKKISSLTMHVMKLWVGHEYGMHKLKVLAVTLTFDIGTCPCTQHIVLL